MHPRLELLLVVYKRAKFLEFSRTPLINFELHRQERKADSVNNRNQEVRLITV